MVVVAAGIRPNVQLARDAGLPVRRGIVVGDDLACPGAEGVYAIGECAEHRGELYGLVAPLWEQARVLADRPTGRGAGAEYRGSQRSTKLKVAGLDVAVMGEKEPAGEDDEVVSYAEPARGIYKKLIVRQDRARRRDSHRGCAGRAGGRAGVRRWRSSGGTAIGAAVPDPDRSAAAGARTDGGRRADLRLQRRLESGPVCASALRASGVMADVLPSSPNSASLVGALADYFGLMSPVERSASR
jgi:hypothetical protein